MEEKEINLKRMQSLLNSFDTDKNIDENPIENTNNEVDENLTVIMNHKGYYVGFNGHSDDIINTLDKFKKELLEAKGLFIQFNVNEKITMTAVGDIMEELNNRANSDIEIIFGTIIDNNIDVNCYEYRILLTGLEEI